MSITILFQNAALTWGNAQCSELPKKTGNPSSNTTACVSPQRQTPEHRGTTTGWPQ